MTLAWGMCSGQSLCLCFSPHVLKNFSLPWCLFFRLEFVSSFLLTQAYSPGEMVEESPDWRNILSQPHITCNHHPISLGELARLLGGHITDFGQFPTATPFCHMPRPLTSAACARLSPKHSFSPLSYLSATFGDVSHSLFLAAVCSATFQDTTLS